MASEQPQEIIADGGRLSAVRIIKHEAVRLAVASRSRSGASRASISIGMICRAAGLIRTRWTERPQWIEQGPLQGPL